MSIEKIGHFLGEKIGRKGLEWLNKKVENFDIKVSGEENLESLKEEAYLLVSNHLKPEENIAVNTGISPDSFILSSLVKKITGQEIKAIQKSDDGWWAKNPIWRSFQKNIGQPLGKGFAEGSGNVPVKKNPGSFNRDFLLLVDGVIKNGEPLLIFPEGNWYEDFEIDHEIKPGAAHIAKKYDLKVVPAYIKGATSWEDGQDISVSFGEPFTVENFEKDEISEKIKEEIHKLQQETEQEVTRQA
ncbi:MAG: lysophospholipid acyltransferase family protein [Candidatus Paceibacterota bacterium]|jgi:1-acyl-sn-glycerol-3-phosphate acyltransferase